ncbi:MAG: hypothetical protein N3E46_10580 [Gemmataceae bacterium]|nr:hypothetical protein [Gemmataceae bacterium]
MARNTSAVYQQVHEDLLTYMDMTSYEGYRKACGEKLFGFVDKEHSKNIEREALAREAGYDGPGLLEGQEAAVKQITGLISERDRLRRQLKRAKEQAADPDARLQKKVEREQTRRKKAEQQLQQLQQERDTLAHHIDRQRALHKRAVTLAQSKPELAMQLLALMSGNNHDDLEKLLSKHGH